VTQDEYRRAWARGVIAACAEGYTYFQALKAATACSVCGAAKEVGDRPAGWAVTGRDGEWFVMCADCRTEA
jgi:hypothetical protein